MSESPKLATIENGQKNDAAIQDQITLFGEIPEADFENTSLGSHSSKSEHIHSTFVETNNRINSTNKYHSSDTVAVINIDGDGKYITKCIQVNWYQSFIRALQQ